MTNKEAQAYIISPVCTSTEPSEEYLKQKQAYDMAIKALEEIDTMKKWLKPCYNCKFNPDRIGNDYTCAFDCDYHYRAYKEEENDTST